MSIYSTWENICDNIVSNKLTNWKNKYEVKYMLEHVAKHFGEIYLENLIKDGVSIDTIKELCLINDKFGGSEPENFEKYNLNVTPASLRYCRHAFDICNLILQKNLNKEVNIIEIGGGYGGLCIILLRLAKKMNINIKNYYIYDLDKVQKLQKYYLSNFFIDDKVIWMNSNSFGCDFFSNELNNNILISNYCLSEIPIEYKDKYLKNLLPKVNGGYFAWNSNDKTNLPENYKEETENPQTAINNKIIKF
jgi:hypothetical protein